VVMGCEVRDKHDVGGNTIMRIYMNGETWWQGPEENKRREIYCK